MGALLASASLAFDSEPPPRGPAVRVLPTGGLSMESAALLISGQQGGDLRFAALALPLPGASERVSVLLVLEIEGRDLVGPTAHFDIAAYVMDQGSQLQGSLVQTVELDLTQLGASAASAGIQFSGELALRPGSYTLRVLVREPVSGRMGLKAFALTVPAVVAGHGWMLPPLVELQGTSWIAAPARLGPGSSSAQLLGLLGGSPAARPLLESGRPISLSVAGGGLEKGAVIRVEIHRSGSLVADLAFRVEAHGAVQQTEVATGTVDLPVLAAGPYEVLAKTPSFSSPPLSIWVVEKGQSARVWTEMQETQATGESGRSASQAGPVASRAHRFAAAAFQAQYRAVLLRPQSEGEAARAELRRIESAQLLSDAPVDLEDIEIAEFHVLAELSSSAPARLVSWALWYEDLHADYLREGSHRMALHSRRLVFLLAKLYVRERPAPPARHVAADLLIALTSQGHAGASFDSEAVHEAVGYEPAHEVARLWLAIDDERHGRYEDAAAQLDVILKANPHRAEAVLRRAVVAAHLGRNQQAAALLDHLIEEGPNPPWVLVVAYQERAKRAIDTQEWARAAAVLDRGLKAFPEDEKLLVEQALLFDLTKRHDQVRATLTQLRPATAIADDSPRHRYAQFPEQEVEAIAAGLRAKVLEGSIP